MRLPENLVYKKRQTEVSIKPYNIQPYATPPKNMIELFHFEEL